VNRRSFVLVNSVERKTTPTIGLSVSEPVRVASSTAVFATPDLSTAAEAVIEAATLPQQPQCDTESIQTLVSASTELIEKTEVGQFTKGDLSALPEAVTKLQPAPASRCPPLNETENGLLDATSQSSGDLVLWFDREIVAPIAYDFSDDEEDNETNYGLLCAKPQNPGAAVLWFDREPIAPIDHDFSDDEEDDEYVNIVADASKSSRYGDLIINPQAAHTETARIASDSDKSSAQVSTLQSHASRSTSISSQSSQASDDVQPGIVLLGNTHACDLMNLVHPGVEGLVSNKQLAQAWVLCVAAEHTKQRTGSLATVQPWDFSITARDTDRALEPQLQRRAKLGGVSLRDFLKKFTLDRDGMTVASKIVPAFCELAGEPEVRSR
jgi:hypothetical protein